MDLKLGTTPTVRLVPPSSMAAPSATVYRADGTVLATLAATPSTVATTVVADGANSRDRFKVASAAGLERGLTLRVTDPQFGAADAVVSTVEGAWVRVVQPLPVAPADGASVVGLDVAVTLPLAATATLGLAYLVEVTDGDASVQLVYNVCRFPVVGPCRARDVRDALATKQASMPLDEARLEELAQEGNDHIRDLLLESHHYVSHYWDPRALEQLRIPVIHLVLCLREGVRDSNTPRDVYIDRLERQIERRVTRLVRGAQPYDENRDGRLSSPAEVERPGAVRLHR